jgi:glycine/D-amino acid oxidase-like deaminating enzyme
VPESPETCDVAIVGGGVHGASAAYHLAGQGYKVVLLERSYPADGPTGLSTAVCRAYYTNGFLAEVAGESLDFLANFAAHTGGDSGFRRCGAVYLHPPSDKADVERTVESLRGMGHDVSLVEAGEVRAHIPGADLAGVGITAWEAGAGYADPVATTKGLLGYAVTHGVRCRMRALVTRLRQRSASWSLTLADGSEVVAARVLVAAGPWTRSLLWTAGVDLSLTAQRHVVATVADPGGLRCVVADVAGGVYIKPEGQAVCIGGLQATAEVSPENPVAGITDSEGARLLGPAAARLPWLAAAGYTGGWASLYDVSPDWQPVIGEVADGLVVDAGTSGHGFKLAPVLGRHVTRLVIGDQADPRLGQFHPARFARGKYLEAGFCDARILA